ncbi:molybdopterin adenylyltransferase [Candidatus Pantoea edessiphila]|uniref:Molybdopterin adenylyltransferase n=1 Tax=Candidatus Pantoea edessiphila TaxID=2044610 RepID=A0A2P5SYA6_9GAMM|nr:molybdopterin adenylyltransferase [Candidatus Pantoea edessiphila]MBK4775617.1 molybdopterin adenylyltransferase [Pantoea sp. Edef]PPI87321.1 molybdopterin adenylyltransferase [Candidatus Pantoea edessiphila]
MNTTKIGLVSISDRAYQGVYQDKNIPILTTWLNNAIITPFQLESYLIPDKQKLIETIICKLVDKHNCHLVLTIGGTGPTEKDVTPDATLKIADREIPGLGEQMRQIGLQFVPTALLSRQVAVIRNRSLIINLPGQPKSIKETLEGSRDQEGNVKISGIFTCIPYCLDLLKNPRIETNPNIISSFRPK